MAIDPMVEINPRSDPTAEDASGEGVHGYSETVEIKPLPDLTVENVSEEGVKEGIRECELRPFGVRSSELGRIRRKRNQSANCELRVIWRKRTRNAIANGERRG